MKISRRMTAGSSLYITFTYFGSNVKCNLESFLVKNRTETIEVSIFDI